MGNFFQERGWGGGGGVAVFTKKINKNLKYLTTKKVYKQKCFSVTIKNLNCEILTKK